MTTDVQTSVPLHVLLTVLGRNPHEACYALGDRQAEAQLAPLALMTLLPAADRPDSVVALCTPEAREESLPLLERALHGRCKVTPIDVPAGEAQEDVKTYLARAAGAIPTGSEVQLTVDVTHGYRHFSFLAYLAVLYLTALRGVRLHGAWYGLLRRDAPSPFLDLRPLLALPRWFHVLEVLRETGSALPMAMALGVEGQATRSVARELSQISEGYLSGLPLELGQQARRFCAQRLKPLKKLLDGDHHLPLAAEMVERLKENLEAFALHEDVTGDGWKRRVALGKPELERQGRIIDDLLQRETYATALGLLNEWTVSWVSWRRGEQGWLDYQGVRRSSASLLGAMAAIRCDPELEQILTKDQRSLGEFWGILCELRNAYHHHGMRAQVLVGNSEIGNKLGRVRNYWETTLRPCPDFSLALGEFRGGRVLVSPIGKRPGVLFSALAACRGDGQADLSSCLVICSGDTEGLIAEAAKHAGFGGTIQPLRLEDPFGGRAEVERLVRAARPHLVGADEMLVNVTGGTTLMGLAADALANAARSLARPVRRFGLIDRRRPEHQEADPYQIGEPFWLDNSEGGDGHGD